MSNLIKFDGIADAVIPKVKDQVKTLNNFLVESAEKVKSLKKEDALAAKETRLEIKRTRLKAKDYIEEEIKKVLAEKKIWDDMEKGYKTLIKAIGETFGYLEDECAKIEKAEEERLKAELALRTENRRAIARQYNATISIIDLETVTDEVWAILEADMKKKWEQEEELRKVQEEEARIAAEKQAEIRRLTDLRTKELAPLAMYATLIEPDLDFQFIGLMDEAKYQTILSKSKELKEEELRKRYEEHERLKKEQEALAEQKRIQQEEAEKKTKALQLAQQRVNHLWSHYHVSLNIEDFIGMTDEKFAEVEKEYKAKQQIAEKEAAEKAIAEQKRLAEEKEKQRQEAEAAAEKARAEAEAKKLREEEIRRAQLPDKNRLLEFADIVERIEMPIAGTASSVEIFAKVQDGRARFVKFIRDNAGLLG